MPKFVIHIGPHKTGTKYIQRRLDENADLLSRQGIYVPIHWRDSLENPSHTYIVRMLKNNEISTIAEEVHRLRSSNHSLIVISTEAIMECDNDMLTALRDMLVGVDFVLVYYVRRWSQLMLSCWNEIVVQGGTIEFMFYASSIMTNAEHSPLINIDRNIKRFSNIFGETKIKLVSYDTVIERGGDIFRHFTRHFLSGPNVLPPTKSRANESTEPEKTELCRILNYLDQEAGNQPSARMIFALRRRRDIDLEPMLGYMRRFRHSLTLQDDRNPIREVLRRNRTTYAGYFVPPVPANASYEPKSVAVEFIGSEYMLAPGFAETVRKLHAELLK